MKKTEIFLIFIIIAGLLYSCDNQDDSNKKLVRQPSKSMKIIDASIPNETLKFEKFFKLEKLILLKNDSTEGFLHQVNKVFFFNNKFLVIDNKVAGVSFFDANGKFLKNLISIGKGPSEFTRIDDVLIDTCANSILVYSNNDYKIAWFNADGLFIKERTVTFNARKMNWLSYPYLIFTTNYGYTGDDGAAYSCIVSDTSGKLIGQHLRHPACDESLSFSGINIAASDTEGPLIAEALEDTVFQVDFSPEEKTLKVKPMAFFSFGKRSLPSINSRCNFFMEHLNSINSDHDFLLGGAFSVQQFFFFTIRKKSRNRWGVLNSRTDSVFLNNIDYGDDYWSYLEVIPRGVMGTGRIIVPVNYVRLFNLYQYYPESYKKLIEDYPVETAEIQKNLLKGSVEESNPFLAIFTIKQ